ncbi:MAG TPA: bifunctional (p)ppGpp synthetase/guanosine-3',5'-bis(diphosphate) 3'-pyrophosphohydrolase, partial [Polyangia bacterium]
MPGTDAGPLLEAVRLHDPGADLELVRRSFEFAAERHAGQLRRSGDPYVVHPLAVAKLIADLRLDVASVCAGLLHDCVEDTSATAEDIGRLFGAEIQMLVEGVTKLGQIAWHTREERQAENFRKMLLAMARDIRVILIKLADRLDNMRTLEHMPRDKQERISRETREIYAPMANRLGIQWMKAELEDLCFRYLEPEEFRALSERMALTEAARARNIAETSEKLREVNRIAGIEAMVSGRAKHLWSIHQKMKKTGRDLEQIHDVVAFRVIVGSVRDCYGALGVVHSTWTPVPGRFKDFIALPKPNLYQSLHTTVIGPNSDRMEVQIRTQEMHHTAEQGIAAHWRYKEKRALGASDNESFAWLRQLMEWQRDLKDPTEFIETVKIDLFEEEVFVFTPKGDVKALPKGSTPIDFAFAVHSKIGALCSGARVNGIIVPLRYQLRNGDTIEILTSNNQKPSKDWLKFVVTSRARTRIRHYLRLEQRERSKRYGRDLLAKELRERNHSLTSAEKEGLLEPAAQKLRAGSADDLLVLIGYGKVNPTVAAEAIYPQRGEDVDAPLRLPPSETTGLHRRPVRKSVGGVRVQGEADIVVKFAKCCTPVPGDPIVAFISRGRGVIVHNPECPKAIDLDPARKVEVSWDEGASTPRPVAVEVISTDRPGILAATSKCFTDHGVNISQAKCKTTEDHRGINTFHVLVG